MNGPGDDENEASIAASLAALEGEPALLDLPFDGAGGDGHSAYSTHAIAPADALDVLARDIAASREAAHLALLALLASLYAAVDSVAIAVHPRGAGAAGGVRIVRLAVDVSRSFGALAHSAEQALSAARRSALVSLADLAGALGAGAGPVVSVHLHESADERDSPAAGGHLAIFFGATRVTLALDGRRFSGAMAARIAGTARHLVAVIRDAPGAPLGELELVTDEDRADILGPFNDTRFSAAGVDDATTLVDLFLRTVATFPGRRAVVAEGGALTYRALSDAAHALASRLVAEGVGVGDRVALLVPPSLDTVIGMLGVLRAGATYLPIDEGTPVERREALLADSGARCLLTRSPVATAVPNLTFAPVGAADARALPTVRSSDGAYLIYTSGTTGTPKGVLVEHRSVVHYVTWFRERYGVGEHDVAALLTSYAFDLGYTTLWTTLLTGGELHLVPPAVRDDAAAVARYFREHRVSFVKLTPSLMGALLASPELDRDAAGALRLVVTGGERVRPRDVATLYERLPAVRVVNHYGPTETTIGVLTTPIERGALAAFAARPVLGRPIGNARVYVTRDGHRLLPIGAPGELLIGGAAVARGYHARPELTAERFVADPFVAGGRAYRSGDLTRFTVDGAVEFLGRVDRQIKVRGYRVEPGEVEHVIVERLGVREVVVVDRVLGEANRVLVAYLVGPARVSGRAAMRDALASALPEYAIPTYFVPIDAIPRNENGKLDARRLPEPALDEAVAAADGPANATERALLAMWAAALGVDAASIGMTANFFDLGGHSLLMIQLLGEIASSLGVTLEIQVFYDEGTIRAIAAQIDAQKGSA